MPRNANKLNIALLGTTRAGKTSTIGSLRLSLDDSLGSLVAGIGENNRGTVTLVKKPINNKIDLFDFFGMELGLNEQTESSTQKFWNSQQYNLHKLHLFSTQFDKIMSEPFEDIDISAIPNESEVDINDQIHAYIWFFRHTEDAPENKEQKANFEKFRRQVQKSGFNPIIVVPNLDSYANKHNISLANLLREDINRSNLYHKFLLPYKLGNTRHVFGVINETAKEFIGGRDYPNHLRLTYLEILHTAMELAKDRIEKVNRDRENH